MPFLRPFPASRPSQERSVGEARADEARAADAVNRAVYAHVTNQCHIEPETVLTNTIRNAKVKFHQISPSFTKFHPAWAAMLGIADRVGAQPPRIRK